MSDEDVQVNRPFQRKGAKSNAHVRSAVVSVNTPGVFVIGMPRVVASATSTLL